eukprot:1696777-Pleurochrysis_carterae.AAC.1
MVRLCGGQAGRRGGGGRAAGNNRRKATSAWCACERRRRSHAGASVWSTMSGGPRMRSAAAKRT